MNRENITLNHNELIKSQDFIGLCGQPLYQKERRYPEIKYKPHYAIFNRFQGAF